MRTIRNAFHHQIQIIIIYIIKCLKVYVGNLTLYTVNTIIPMKNSHHSILTYNYIHEKNIMHPACNAFH